MCIRDRPRAKYKAEHEAELIQFYAARRKLTGEFPDGKVDMKKLSDEYDAVSYTHLDVYKRQVLSLRDSCTYITGIPKGSHSL